MENLNQTETKHSLQSFISTKDYLTAIQRGRRESTIRDSKYQMGVVCRLLGELKLTEITAKHIQGYIDTRVDSGMAQGTVKSEVGKLKQALDIARDLGLIKVNPYDSMRGSTLYKLPKISPKKIKVMSDDQFWRIVKVMPFGPKEYLRDITMAGLHLGVRRANLCGLRWKHIQWHADVPHVLIPGESMKGRKDTIREDHAVPMSLTVKLILARRFYHQVHQFRRSTLVFTAWRRYGMPLAPDMVTKGFARCATKSGVRAEAETDFTFHDIRHKFVSDLLRKGVGVYQVKELVGHGDITTTMRYAHAVLGDKADALAKAFT